MKFLKLFLFICWPLLGFSQTTYKGLSVIKAISNKADYRIGQDWQRGKWNITPQANPDVLTISCFSGTEKVGFYTDSDSLVCNLKPNESKQFYVLLNNQDYALTELQGIAYPALTFDNKSTNPDFKMFYEANSNQEFLKTLRRKYQLDDVIKGAKNDTEKALKMMNWVHKQWEHNGMNQPSKTDALTILEEAKNGKMFRCVEYGIVTTACLNAVGLKSRVLGLKMKEVETTESGAGHVVMETYLNDLGKWVMLDGQWDAMPMFNNVPLNAIEFQNAIVNNFDKLEIKSLSGTNKRSYVNWIAPYLYYFDVKFDNREGRDLERAKINGKGSLMLVPSGAKNPAVFQQKFPIDYCFYTNSVADFYAKPKI